MASWLDETIEAPSGTPLVRTPEGPINSARIERRPGLSCPQGHPALNAAVPSASHYGSQETSPRKLQLEVASTPQPPHGGPDPMSSHRCASGGSLAKASPDGEERGFHPFPAADAKALLDIVQS